MQAPFHKLRKYRVDTLPIIDQVIARLGLREAFGEALGYERRGAAMELLLKSILINPQALYRVNEWKASFDPRFLPTGEFPDDALGRALDKLFAADRASLQTRIALSAIREFQLSVDEIHNDATTVKFWGAYRRQNPKAVALKRGYSKDHRPDLKQLVANFSVTADGGVPIHYKAYSGNTTETTTHWEGWLAVRGLLGKTGFLYVADSKLCVSESMLRIDREHGRFITVVPRSRKETQLFAQEVYDCAVRWRCLWRKKVPGHRGRLDVFEVAEGTYQLDEGFALHWFRSSQKRHRDAEERADKIAATIDDLSQLENSPRRQPRSAKTLHRRAEKILERHGSAEYFIVEVVSRTEERFIKTNRGRATPDALYRRKDKQVFELRWRKNQEQIDRAKALDGIFPLTTNTPLKPLDVLQNYKYQPTLEKRFSLLKSDLCVAPVFLKKNERIEALFFVYFLAEVISSLVERQLRQQMKVRKIETLSILPEERPSATPTWQQVSRLFEHHARYDLLSSHHKVTQAFSDPISSEQALVLSLLGVDQTAFR